jgi:predicted nucleic acid-binding protein
MAYLLDTDWAIRSLKGRVEPGETLRRLQGSYIAVSMISVVELYEGAFRSPNPAAYLTNLRHFLAAYHRIQVDDNVAATFGELRATLRRRGQLIADFDLVIASTALAYDLTLLTFNRRHFERIPELKLYQPAE